MEEDKSNRIGLTDAQLAVSAGPDYDLLAEGQAFIDEEKLPPRCKHSEPIGGELHSVLY